MTNTQRASIIFRNVLRYSLASLGALNIYAGDYGLGTALFALAIIV